MARRPRPSPPPSRPAPPRAAPPRAPEEVFAVVAPGLEPALVDELEAFGVSARAEAGGATFRADRRTLYLLHLHARVAGRFWVRVGRFAAPSLDVLGDRVRALPWERYVFPRQPVDVRVTSHGSRLRHKDSVAKKVAFAVSDAARVPRRTDDRRPERSPIAVLVRLDGDECTVSVDASGEHLHRRGWRTEAGEAPLRENLAAAVLWLAGWRPGEPLLDPMCGAGTFVIEAAQIAQSLAAGRGRSFAFQGWPDHDAATWAAVCAEPADPPVPCPILGSDRDERVIATARANAKRAGVAQAVSFAVADATQAVIPPGRGLVIANPPYGARLPEARPAWRALGELLRGPCAEWRWAILCPHPSLLAAAKLPARPVATFPNGGLRVTLHVRDPAKQG
jgi:putative N6-adenine-specific DNA methylase